MRHPARFVLVGSGNPEEGELRPQLLDRFGLSVEVRTPSDLPTRVEVVRRRDEFERDPEAFVAQWQKDEDKTAQRIVTARERLAAVDVPDAALERAAQLCMALGTDGLRGELTLMRAARALAALEGDERGRRPHLRRVAPPGAAPSPAPRPARRCRLHGARRARDARSCSAHDRVSRRPRPIRPVVTGGARRQRWAAVGPCALIWRRSVRPGRRPAPRCRSGAHRWLELLNRSARGPGAARMPLAIADERLLGGLDLAATCAAGRPVAQRGLLAKAMAAW